MSAFPLTITALLPVSPVGVSLLLRAELFAAASRRTLLRRELVLLSPLRSAAPELVEAGACVPSFSAEDVSGFSGSDTTMSRAAEVRETGRDESPPLPAGRLVALLACKLVALPARLLAPDPILRRQRWGGVEGGEVKGREQREWVDDRGRAGDRSEGQVKRQRGS